MQPLRQIRTVMLLLSEIFKLPWSCIGQRVNVGRVFTTHSYLSEGNQKCPEKNLPFCTGLWENGWNSLLYFLFSRDVTREPLKTLLVVHADATFRISPNCFTNCHLKNFFNGFRCSMRSWLKSQLMYDALFLFKRNVFPSLKRNKYVVDFKTRLHSSIQLSIESQMQGCLSHFRSTFWRNPSKLAIGENEGIFICQKILMALLLDKRCFLTFLAPTVYIKARNKGN